MLTILVDVNGEEIHFYSMKQEDAAIKKGLCLSSVFEHKLQLT